MEQKHRSEFPEKELWDLTALYQDREDFLRAIEKSREDINQFRRDYKDNLHTFEDFEKAFAELEQNLHSDEPYWKLWIYASDDRL